MNRSAERIFVTSLIFIIAGTLLFAGCGKTIEGIDKVRSQLWVKYYNGGVGRQWLDDIIADFEKDYADVSFEEGKKGVEVKKDFTKDTPSASSIQGNPNQVYIIEDVHYTEFVANNTMMDITDLVQSPAIVSGDVTEEKTIESKISNDRKKHYNLGTEAQPEYYALPFFLSSMDLNYNVDLFERNNYYFAKGKTAEGMPYEELTDYEKVYDLFIQNPTDGKSFGPDNKPDTYDDGLPATYDDFQALITMIEADGVIPFIWNGTSTAYCTQLANNIWANAEGKEQFGMAFTFRGEANTLINMNNGENFLDENDKPIMLGKTAVVPENAYMLHAQKGKYDALRFVDMIMSSKYYKNSFTVNYLDAQDYFINGYGDGNQQIAMLIDGTWWYNEAQKSFRSEQEKMTRKFGVLPLPKTDASHLGEPLTKISERESLMFISNYCDDYAIPIAKLFLRYINSDKTLNYFTKKTSMLRALDYALTDETKKDMNYFGKNVFETSTDEGTEWLEWMPQSKEAKKEKTLLDRNEWGFSTGKGSNPFERFYKEKSMTPEKYMAESYNYIKKKWNVKSL